MRVAIILLIAAAFAPCGHPQGISPLISELKQGKKDTKTEMQVINASVHPLTAVLEVREIKFKDGKGSVIPVTSNLHVQLSETTIKIPPQQTRTILINAKCDQLPCAFAIQSTFSGARTNVGTSIRISLGNSWYVCERTKDCRANFQKQ